MEHLPPMRWDELATKADLRALEERLTALLDERMGKLEERIGGLDQRIGGLAIRTDGIDQRLDWLGSGLERLDRRLEDFGQALNFTREQLAANSADLAGLREFVDERTSRLDESMARLQGDVTAAFRGELVATVAGQTRQMMYGMVATVLSVGGLSLALQQFAG